MTTGPSLPILRVCVSPRHSLRAHCPLPSSAGLGDPSFCWQSTMAQIGMAHRYRCQGDTKPVWAQDRSQGTVPGATLPLTIACCLPGRVLLPMASRVCRAPRGVPDPVVAAGAAQLCPFQLPVHVGAWAGEPRLGLSCWECKEPSPTWDQSSNQKRGNKGFTHPPPAPSKHTAHSKC